MRFFLSRTPLLLLLLSVAPPRRGVARPPTTAERTAPRRAWARDALAETAKAIAGGWVCFCEGTRRSLVEEKEVVCAGGRGRTHRRKPSASGVERGQARTGTNAASHGHSVESAPCPGLACFLALAGPRRFCVETAPHSRAAPCANPAARRARLLSRRTGRHRPVPDLLLRGHRLHGVRVRRDAGQSEGGAETPRHAPALDPAHRPVGGLHGRARTLPTGRRCCRRVFPGGMGCGNRACRRHNSRLVAGLCRRVCASSCVSGCMDALADN